MPNVKDIGNKTEHLCLHELCTKKYWCHLFAYTTSGQPCDIVALKENKSILLDVKHCKNNVFETRRIEANQRTCFTYATSLNIKCGFALYSEIDKVFYYLDFKLVQELENTKSFKLSALPLMKDVL